MTEVDKVIELLKEGKTKDEIREKYSGGIYGSAKVKYERLKREGKLNDVKSQPPAKPKKRVKPKKTAKTIDSPAKEGDAPSDEGEKFLDITLI